MDLDLAGRVYLVTGGTRGLGRATAAALVADGAHVVVTGRGPEAVEAVVADLEAIGGEGCALGVVADNGEPDTPARLITAAREQWQRLDGALVSVGGPPPGPPSAITDIQWQGAFDAVFLGTVRLLREVGLELAAHGGGSLALVLSTSVREPITGLAVSNGLRPGLGMVAKDLADELGPRGVRVNGLLPGRVSTERVAELDAATGDAAAARATNEARIPLGRYGEPDEFGRVAAFVLSPAASFVTGAMVPVDGGLSRSL
ncbi:SDR family NAD(P)-dependent oxidoreductase [Nocardioides sp.]|uniref:SDR family NAD(P)-dependent oxidoreductase n=1 Tax=Nocardioides sp. TaxID=35761 RepID=UPI003517BEF6